MVLGFQVWDIFSNYHLFFRINFHMLVIHDSVVRLVSDGKLLDNIGPEMPMLIFCLLLSPLGSVL